MTIEIEPRFRTVPSNWRGAVLVCRKCTKKLGGGFGPRGKQSLAKALRKAKHSRMGRRSSFGVAEVPCLGICPHDAVTVIDGSAPGRWLVVPKGTDVEAVVAYLASHSRHPGLDPGPVKIERRGDSDPGSSPG